MKRILILLTVATLTTQAADQPAIARVGATNISSAELQPLLANLNDRERAAISRDPALLNQWIRTFAAQQLLFQEAQSKNWAAQPDVAAQLEQIRQNAIAESYLRSVSQPSKDYPSDAELQAAYDANKEKLIVPKQVRLAQIFVALPANANKELTAAAAVQLDAVRKALAQPGADFAAIAKQQSDDAASVNQGGELGWLAESQLQPEIRNAIATLVKGTVSPAVRLPDGWHFLKVLEVKDAYTPPLAEVRGPLIEQLRAARLRANSEAYLAGLLKANPVAINEIAVSQLLEPARK